MRTKDVLLIAVLVCAVSGSFAKADTPPPTPLLTQSADKLIAVLRSNASRKEKADACRELAVVGNRKAVPVLADLLADPELSHMARYALETIPGSAVDRALRDELNWLNGRLLVGVIGSIGARKDAKAVKPLSLLLPNSDPEVAQAAARALGSIGTTQAARAIEEAMSKTAPANRLAFAEGLFRCAETWAAKGKRKDAIALYDRLRGMQEVPVQTRAAALRGAILIRGDKDLALLKESLESNDRVLFSAAVRAALDESASGALITSLPRLQAGNRIVVMEALGKIGDASAVRELYDYTKEGTAASRAAAIRAIAAVGHASSVPVMVEHLAASEKEVAQAALEGLAGIPGAEADAAVLKLIKSPKVESRMFGIELAGRRRMVNAAPALLTAATDFDAKVRSSVLQRLGKLGTPAEVPALIQLLLRTTDEQDLDGLAIALSSICSSAGSPAPATAQVIGALSGAKPTQKAALLSVLSAVGGERALISVRVALQNSNMEVRAAAVQALADWPDAAAAPDLMKILHATTDNKERDVAFRGYVRLAREAGGTPAAKLKLLTEAATVAASPQEKKLVLAGYGDVPTVESLRLVMPHLADPAVADEAGAAAVKIAEKLDAKDLGDIGLALNLVLKSAKSRQVLNQARKRMDELKLPVR